MLIIDMLFEILAEFALMLYMFVEMLTEFVLIEFIRL